MTLFTGLAKILFPAILALQTQQTHEPGPGDQIFDTTRVIQLHLAFSKEQYQALAPARAAGRGFRFPGDRTTEEPDPQNPGESATRRNLFGTEMPWTHADLTVEGETCHDIGVRFKGNYTLMATQGRLKRSMKLDINRFVDGQKLDGLSTLNLHCGVTDPTLSREAFSYQVFRDAGIPAPRTCFAEVTLAVPETFDNQLLGVYTLAEQVNKAFLKRHFGNGSGMLLKPEGLLNGPVYLGTEWSDYQKRYRPEDDPEDAAKARLMEFSRLISEGSDEEFASRIGEYLDVDAFLRFIAANALLANLDSYLGYGHNYYLYLVPDTGQFVFIPWDLDLSLATWPAGGTPEQLVELSLSHPHAGDNPLLDRLLSIDSVRDRYWNTLKELCGECFNESALLAKLQPIEAALEEPMRREADAVSNRQKNLLPDGKGFAFAYGQFGQTLTPRQFIERRTASVEAQLRGEKDGFVPKPFGIGAPGGGRPRGGDPGRNF